MIQHRTASGDTVSIPTWLWTGLGAMLLLTTGGIGTWAGATLIANGGQLVNHEARISNMERNQERVLEKLDRLLELNGVRP